VIATDQPLDESLIAQRFGTSRNSVRQALQMLAAEGLVTRQTRLGTSVSGKIAELPIVNIGIASVASAHDQNYEGITHEIIDLQYIPAPALIQNRLATTDEEVLLVESLLSLKSTPLYVTVGYICVGECSRQVLVDRVRELYRSPQDLDSSMLLLYGKHFGHARTSIEATACDARTARLLGVAEGAPILFRDRVLYDEDGQPRDLSYSHLRGDRTALTAEFFRATG
jgi:GntR family transcriptional regulator